jgi:hypothetical protein
VNRSMLTVVIAVVLVAYGIWTALYVPAMLVPPTPVLLLVCFVLEAIAAIAAGIAAWQGRRAWAAAAVVLLGAAIAATQLIEILLGIVPYLRAIAIAVAAVVAALVLATLLRSAPQPRAISAGP